MIWKSISQYKESEIKDATAYCTRLNYGLIKFFFRYFMHLRIRAGRRMFFQSRAVEVYSSPLMSQSNRQLGHFGLQRGVADEQICTHFPYGCICYADTPGTPPVLTTDYL